MFLFFAGESAAQHKDSVVLKDGDHLSGALIEVTLSHVVLSTAHSGVVDISRTSVERLESTRPMAVTLTTGERIDGPTLSLVNGKIHITSPSFGGHSIALSQVASIMPVLSADQPHNDQTRKTTQSQDKLALSSAVKPTAASLYEVRGKGNGEALPSSTTAAPDSKPVAGPKPIGQRPDDDEDIRKLFLRQSSVLLSPGQFEVEAGLQYQRVRVDTTILNTMNRQLSIPMSLRVGLADRWQGFVSMPLAYGYQQMTFSGEGQAYHNAGVGDISAGLNYQLLSEGGGWPDIVALAGFSAPTGRSPYEDEDDGVGVALGSGHWWANMGLQFIKTEDPVAIFGGLTYTHYFPSNGLGQRIKLGNAVGYNLGLSFAINDRVSVSGEFLGSAQGETYQDGQLMVGTSREPMQLRTGMIYRATKDWFLAPTLTYSLNSDAPDVIIGVSSSHRFQ